VHAAEIVGERWALLIVRDLLVRPKRFTDLKHGLPRIPTNVLSTRLKELEASDVVERVVLPHPDRSVVYQLTEYGRDLEDIVLALGRWGARTMGEPAADDIVTVDSMIMAFRSTYRPNGKGTVAYQLNLGEILLRIDIADGALAVIDGRHPAPDLTITADLAIKALMAGEISARDAIDAGSVVLDGPPELFDRFLTTFRI
jgi:DNA-binding HxlR family transcriptional regulator